MVPDFATAVEQLWAKGVRQVRVLPVFLASGKHLRVDLPQLIQDAQSKHPGLNVQVLPAVGLTEEVQNAVVNLALAS
jgi:sirohydrochlorin cobaltochelatase